MRTGTIYYWLSNTTNNMIQNTEKTQSSSSWRDSEYGAETCNVENVEQHNINCTFLDQLQFPNHRWQYMYNKKIDLYIGISTCINHSSNVKTLLYIYIL